MIIKKRPVPLKIQLIEALLRRLPKDHSKREEIRKDLSKRYAGYRGEQALDFFLNQLSTEEFHIFHDLRLNNETIYFQIDTLLISRHFILILEVKNIAGTLFFDTEFDQLIRKMEEKEEGFRNPLTQAEFLREQLATWLEKRKIPYPAIESLVVISYPSTILRTQPGNRHVYQKVVHAENLIKKIKALKQRHGNKKGGAILLEKLDYHLLKENSPLKPNILQQNDIEKVELIRGAQCPNCNFAPMERIRGSWLCLRCNCCSKTPHEQAIIDYLLLVNPTITNQQCRQYLKLSSRNIATKLLSSMDLAHEGSGKGRFYRLPTPDKE